MLLARASPEWLRSDTLTGGLTVRSSSDWNWGWHHLGAQVGGPHGRVISVSPCGLGTWFSQCCGRSGSCGSYTYPRVEHMSIAPFRFESQKPCGAPLGTSATRAGCVQGTSGFSYQENAQQATCHQGALMTYTGYGPWWVAEWGMTGGGSYPQRILSPLTLRP